MMEYKIVEKAAFTVMGKSRMFNADTSNTKIPKFWQEHGLCSRAIPGICRK